MDRNSEYKKLLSDLENTPLKLDYTVARARARKASRDKRRRVAKAVFIPLGTLAAVFLIFAALVNFSAPFADACSKIPVLDRLAEAVSMSPSLSDAVSNDYAQEIGQKQTKNGVTACIEYVIVDQKELVVFYSLSSDKYAEMQASCEVTSIDKGYCVTSSYAPGIEDGSLRRIVVSFVDDYDMPDTLDIRLTVGEGINDGEDDETETWPGDGEEIADFDFTLDFDPAYTSAGESFEIGRSFEIDGQTLTLETIEIYPTHMRLNFSADDDNTKWLKNLDFYVENSEGETFGFDYSGTMVSSIGYADTPMVSTYLIQSAYFRDTEHLKLYVTGATWLDKGSERIHVDLESGTADNLPDGIELALVKQNADGWRLFFTSPVAQDGASYEYMGWQYYDAEGDFHALGTRYSTDSWTDEDTGETIGGGNVRVEEIDIPATESEIWLPVIYSGETQLDTPLEVEIK